MYMQKITIKMNLQKMYMQKYTLKYNYKKCTFKYDVHVKCTCKNVSEK